MRANRYQLLLKVFLRCILFYVPVIFGGGDLYRFFAHKKKIKQIAYDTEPNKGEKRGLSKSNSQTHNDWPCALFTGRDERESHGKPRAFEFERAYPSESSERVV